MAYSVVVEMLVATAKAYSLCDLGLGEIAVSVAGSKDGFHATYERSSIGVVVLRRPAQKIGRLLAPAQLVHRKACLIGPQRGQKAARVANTRKSVLIAASIKKIDTEFGKRVPGLAGLSASAFSNCSLALSRSPMWL